MRILAWRWSPELTINKNLPSMFRAFLGYTLIFLRRKANIFFFQLKFLHLVPQALDSPCPNLVVFPTAPLSLPPAAPKTFPAAPKLLATAPPNFLSVLGVSKLFPGASPSPNIRSLTSRTFSSWKWQCRVWKTVSDVKKKPEEQSWCHPDSLVPLHTCTKPLQSFTLKSAQSNWILNHKKT